MTRLFKEQCKVVEGLGPQEDRVGKLKGNDTEEDQEINPLTPEEERIFLETAGKHYPRYYPLFLCALRTGLRRGELMGLKWGNIQFGRDENDPNRFILVKRSYSKGRFSTPKSGKSRRVDMSRQLRQVLLELRHKMKVETLTLQRQLGILVQHIAR